MFAICKHNVIIHQRWKGLTAMSITVEEGKSYRARCGDKIGPMVRARGYGFSADYDFAAKYEGQVTAWTGTGQFLAGHSDQPLDLVEEWQDDVPTSTVAVVEGRETQAALAEAGQAAAVPESPEQPLAQRVHELKSWVGLFGPIASGAKTHDLRVMDRDFRVGDQCRLREWSATTRTYTGRECTVAITYITSGSRSPGHNACAFSPVALHPDMAVLSIRLVEHRPAA